MEKLMIIEGTKLRVKQNHPHYSSLKFVLTIFDSDGSLKKLYEEDSESKDLIINRGLIPILEKMNALKQSEIHDTTPNNLSINEDIIVPRDLLKGIELRPEQELAIMRSLKNHRGLIQAATGAGKTYMICGVLQFLKNKFGRYPNSIILVPTQYLMESFQENLESLGIPSQIYNDCRGELNGIVIAHPKSLNNDLDKGLINLNNVEVLIADESHHVAATTWMRLFLGSVNAQYVLGFSASIIDSRNLPIQRLSDLTYDELKIIESTGDVLLDVPPSYYSDGTVLAKALVARIQHTITEPIMDSKNWHQIRSQQLESGNRSMLIVNSAKCLNSYGLKVLILINTHEHGYRLLDMFNKIGLGSITACSYGNNVFYQIVNDKRVKLSKDSMNKFKTGELQILIGSSHVYEGVDIPNLDAVIMAVVGRNNRRIIQGVGRSLRRTKNGKYSYIIDFTDNNSGVLQYHSNERRKMYSNLIGVPENRIFDSITIDNFNNLLQNIEVNDIDL